MEALDHDIQKLFTEFNTFSSKNLFKLDTIPKPIENGLDSLEAKILKILKTLPKYDAPNFGRKLIGIVDSNFFSLEETKDLNEPGADLNLMPQTYFKCVVLKIILTILIENNLFESDTQGFNFATLYNTLLLHYDSMETLALELFNMTVSFDFSLFNFSNIVEIIKKSFSIFSNADESIVNLKHKLMTTLLHLASINRNLFQFHELFIHSTNKMTNDEILFSKDFEHLYSEKIFELSFAQNFKIWKLFLDNFCITKLSQIRLFNLFLSHIKIFDSQIVDFNRTELDKLILNTLSLIANFTTKDEHILSIYYSIACSKFLLNSYDNEVAESSKSNDIKLYDMSDLFSQTESSQWESIYEYFDDLNPDSKMTFVKLMLVKFKILKSASYDYQHECQENFSISLTDSLSDVVSKITTNQNLSTFDVLKVVIPKLNCDQLTLLVDNLFENIVINETANASFYQIFSFSPIWESVHFQSIFITSYLKIIILYLNNSKRKFDCDDQSYCTLSQSLKYLVKKEMLWIKCAKLTPDSEDSKMEKILSLIKNSSNFIELNKVVPIEKNNFRKILNLMSLFYDCVPLEYLSPVNQLRSLIAFSGILLSLQNIEADDRSNYINLFIQINMRIWDSVRSNWLFKFISPSQYIYLVLHSLQPQMDNRCYFLFGKYVENLYKLNDCQLSYQNVNNLIEVINTNELDVKLQYILMVQTIILQNNAQFLKKLENNNKFQSQVELFDSIGKSISSIIYKNIKRYLDETENCQQLDSLFVIEGLTKLFEYKIFYNMTDSKEIVLRSKWKNLLSKFINISLANISSSNINKSFVQFLKVIVENRNKLTDTLPENFILDLWSKLIEFNFDGQPFDGLYTEKISSSSYWKKIYNNEKKYNKFMAILDKSNATDHLTLDCHLKQYMSLFDTIGPLVVPIANSSTAEEFSQIIHSCDEVFGQSNTIRSIYAGRLFLQICNSNIDHEKAAILKDRFELTLTSLINFCFSCNKRDYFDEIEVQLKLVALELGKSILVHLISNDLIMNCHLFLIYSLCIESNLVEYSGNLGLFSKMFLLLNDIIFEIIMKRPHLAIFSMCSQINIITMLLVALLKSSSEKNLINTTDSDKLNIENCSKSLSQTLVQLSNIDEFKPYAIHLISFYLTKSHNANVCHLVKKNLNLAIYNLINLIKDKELIERLYSRLSQKSREVFKLLLEHYDKYYRFKGYV